MIVPSTNVMDQIPIITRPARIALWTALILSILDFGLMIGNLGLTSFFIGMCATSMSIIHLSTHLILVRVRETRARRRASVTQGAHTKSVADAGVFPPTSTLPSLSVSIFIAICYLAAFGMSVFGLATGELYMLVPAVVYIDAVFEVLCAGALAWLVVVGMKERKKYLEFTSKIRLEDVPTTSG